MASDLAWRPLPLATSTGIPVLLISVTVGAASYTVQVTDMANIWAETLDRKAICMRGWNENTSIDPSDTPENMTKFLSSLRCALDSSQKGHDQTSLTLSPDSRADAGEDGLTIKVTCPLPGFQPLKWPCYLKKSPASAIATDLVLPLVEAHLARNLEVESLIQTMNNKDSVISKLVDKLEATGTGLENVFTTLSGKKKVSRAIAEEKVRGLAPFEHRRWRSSINDPDGWPKTASDLVERVFGGDGLSNQSMMQVDSSPELDKWWLDFQGTSQLAHRSQQQTHPQVRRTPSPPPVPTADDDDDDFQVQATPPHLQSEKKPVPKSTAQLEDDASTEDEEDEPSSLDLPPMNSKTNTKLATSRLGMIGKDKGSVAPPSLTTRAEGPPATQLPVIGDDAETASEASDVDETASKPVAAPSSGVLPADPPKTTAKRGVLGRIGGPASKARALNREKTPEPEEEEKSEVAPPPSRKKLGVIGKKIGGVAKAPGEDDAGRGRSATRQDDQPTETRETSQERADRRREELKRELEKKAAAGPSKKKRRF